MAEEFKDVSIKDAVRKFTKLRIQEKLQDTLEMPPLSATAKKIIALRGKNYAAVDELSDIIKNDPSLSAQVIGWASSAYYSAPGKIHSVHDAIVRVLGYDLVLNIASGIAISTVIKVKNQKQYWLDSVWVAALADRLAKNCNAISDPSVCYLSGLLHNFGYLIVAQVFPQHFVTIENSLKANVSTNRYNAELDLLGITGEQVAGTLLKEWGLPDPIYVGIMNQNDEQYSGKYWEVSNLLFLCVQVLRENSLYAGNAIAYDHIFGRLGLKQEDLKKVFDKMLEKADGINKIAASMAS